MCVCESACACVHVNACACTRVPVSVDMHTMRMCARAHTHAGDTTKVRELRQRLVEEEEKRIRRVEEERQRMEEEVRMTRDEAELLRTRRLIDRDLALLPSSSVRQSGVSDAGI